MNVLFVQPALPLYRVPFFERLQQDDWSVRVWSDHRSSLHAHSGPWTFDAAHKPERQVRGLVYQPALVEAVVTRWADVVVLPWNTRYIQLLPAVLEARRRGKPVVLWGHGYSKREGRLRRRVRNAWGRLATACITYSEPTRARLIALGFSAERTFCAPNALHDRPLGAALNPTVQTTVLRGPAPEVPPSAHTVLFVSRLEADKKPTRLLDAFALVRTLVPEARLVVVGTGTQANAMKRHAELLGLGTSVTFTGAIYDETTLAQLFSRSQVFAYPAAIGLSLLHAFSYGVPVVTSQNAELHNPEFESLIPNVNGLTYVDDDVQDFARQIVLVLKDSDLRARLSRGALAAVSPPEGKTLGAMVSGMRRALEYATTTGARRD